MDNYWAEVGHQHHVDLEVIERLCFQLLCMFKASDGLAFRYIANEEEAEETGELESVNPDDDQLLSFHAKFVNSEVSKVLLTLAMTLRVYDDQMKDSAYSRAYKGHVEKYGGDGYIGGTDDSKRFNYRDACNKVIHARKLNFLREQVDSDGGEEQVKVCTGEIEITGTKGKNSWFALLYVEEFVEVILDVIGFGYPD